MNTILNTSPNYKRPLLATIKSVLLDLKYGGKILDFEVKSPFQDIGIYNSQNTEYDELSQIFTQISLNKKDVFVDVGCGAGRVINYILQKKIEGTIYGIEIDSEIGNFTKSRLAKYKNVKILIGDFLEVAPNDATILYFFNPCNFEYMVKIIRYIENTYFKIRIIYLNCECLDLFLNRCGWKVLKLFDVYPNSRNTVFKCIYLEFKKD